jgi:hypothetical protein
MREDFRGGGCHLPTEMTLKETMIWWILILRFGVILGSNKLLDLVDGKERWLWPD